MQAALHPTPAVCGRPRLAAKDILASQEPFDRGFYSGPFGWVSGRAAEFVVAIRSALIHAQPLSTTASAILPNGLAQSASESGPNKSYVTSSSASSSQTGTISLFAGVGIVKGSTAEAEWQVGPYNQEQLVVILHKRLTKEVTLLCDIASACICSLLIILSW